MNIMSSIGKAAKAFGVAVREAISMNNRIDEDRRQGKDITNPLVMDEIIGPQKKPR